MAFILKSHIGTITVELSTSVSVYRHAQVLVKQNKYGFYTGNSDIETTIVVLSHVL